MPNIKLTDYYNRYNPGKNYDRLAFRANRAAQSAEQNEMQSIFNGKLKNIADALFKDGDIIRDGRIFYDEKTGKARCEAGLIYIAGAVRSVPEKELLVSSKGVVSIGVFLKEDIITELEDPELYNPAVGTRSEGEPGAARIRISLSWGISTENSGSNFFPVHTIEDGNLQAKEAPPNLDSLTQALARYDRDSSGGTYIVSGLNVSESQHNRIKEEYKYQVYYISEGRARVSGYPVEFITSRRLLYPAEPELVKIESEVHTSLSSSLEDIILDKYPVYDVSKVRFTKETTETITHGAYTNAADLLPHQSVVKVVEVKQGNVVFNKNSDYKFSAGKIDWSPAGPEPSPNSTYTVKYQYIETDNKPIANDSKYTGNFDSVQIYNAVPGTQIFVDYLYMPPRYDRLCIDRDGSFLWLKGVASEISPQPPQVPDGLLLLATIKQIWDGKPQIINDGIKVIPMNEIAAINSRIDELTEQMAQQRLASDLFTREAGAKKGVFVDPFLSDQMRDKGITQTAAIVDGNLCLPITNAKSVFTTKDIEKATHLNYKAGMALEQLANTGEMRVNPYSALEPLPGLALLNPNVDRWTDLQTNWASGITRIFNEGHYVPSFAGSYVFATNTTHEQQVLKTETTQLQYLRSIKVNYKVTGFGPNEIMTMTFDGISVKPSQNKADSNGTLEGFFTIPYDVPAGVKSVVFTGSGGSKATAIFVGQGTLTVQTLRNVTNRILYWHDPLAQTFSLEEACQLCGIELWFTKKHTSKVIVQIRETTVGIPNQNVLGEAILEPKDLRVDGSATRAIFNMPVSINPETEYAIVIMCDDAVTSVAIAELGKWDKTNSRWVTAQPYQVGVLLSSSNASTWTPHQNMDLTFRLLKADYQEMKAEVSLGSVEVQKATDLILLPVSEEPNSQTRIEYYLDMPDGSTISVYDRQSIKLPKPVDGTIKVKAKLIGSGTASPVIHPGTQLVSGEIRPSADYITRAVPAGTGSKVKIILDAQLPAGSKVDVQLLEDSNSKLVDVKFKNSRQIDEDWYELIYEGQTSDNLVRAKIILSGTPSARPRVDNLRVLTI